MLRFLLVGALFFISEFGFAQLTRTQFSQLNEENGLAQNFVYGIVKDKRGFIWVSTGNGLTRFDGKDTRIFTTENGLADNFITESYQAKNGRILFGHFQGSISSYNGAFFETIIGDTLNSEIVSITESDKGIIYAATRSKGLVVWNELSAPQIIFPAELQGKIINQIKVAGTQLITATSEGIYTFQIDGQQLIFNDAPEDLLYQEITSLETFKNDSQLIWAGTSNGLYLIRTGTFTKVEHHLFAEQLGSADVRAIVHHTDHSLWIGTHQKGLFHFMLERDTVVSSIAHFDEASGFPIFSVNTMYIEQEGSIWVGTLSNGLVKLYEPFFKYYEAPKEIKNVNAIEEWNGQYLVATDKGLFRFDPSSPTLIKQFQRIAGFDEPVHTIKVKQDELWMGTQNNGVLVYDLIKKKTRKISFNGLEQRTIRARLFEIDKEGNVWISAMENGVILVDKSGNVLNHLSTNNGFIHNDIYTICASSNREVWFGSLGAGLAKLNIDGEIVRLSQQDIFPSHDINDITEHDGKIWITSDGQGYFKYDNESFKRVGPSQESVSPFIKSLIVDLNERLWMTSRKSIGYQDLNTGKTRYYDKNDGLLEKEDYASELFIDSKGNLLLPNERGISVFNTEKVGKAVVLDTYLTEIKISFSPFTPPEPSNEEMKNGIYPPVMLRYDQNHVTLNYRAMDTNYNGKVYYRYYLENLEEGWSPPSTNSSITYTSLEPGTYTLRAQATNDLRTWVDKPLTYTFVINKPYWNTWWFYLLQMAGITVLFGITYLLIRNPATKRSLGRVMVFMCIFIVFDYLQNWLEPITPEFIGSVPLYKTLLNLTLALILFPVERGIKDLFTKQRESKSQEED
ncbi:MAG: two-component regulator propeller domain-containing protein [Cyclobacteriaceae bacterium]